VLGECAACDGNRLRGGIEGDGTRRVRALVDRDNVLWLAHARGLRETVEVMGSSTKKRDDHA
jgi:hypothetical protein